LGKADGGEGTKSGSPQGRVNWIFLISAQKEIPTTTKGTKKKGVHQTGKTKKGKKKGPNLTPKRFFNTFDIEG